MIDEYALKEAFNKLKKEIDEIKENIRFLNEKINDVSTEDYTEELIESSAIKESNPQEEVNLTDSYY